MPLGKYVIFFPLKPMHLMVLQVMPLMNKQEEKWSKLKSVQLGWFRPATAFSGGTFLFG